jgi:hypothetical protein
MAEIRLTQNQVTTIDEQDFEVVNLHRWYAHKTAEGKFYAVSDIEDEQGETVRTYLHRLLTEPAEGFGTYHKDGDGLNNQRDNLLVCAKGQHTRVGHEDTLRGVYYVPKGKKKWRAIITVNGKPRHLGVFETKAEAVIARDAAAIEQWGEHAKLNSNKENSI